MRRASALLLVASALCLVSQRAVRFCGGVAHAAADDGRPSVYVYVHTDVKFATLEKTLKDRLPNLAVTVFGRFRDLEDAMQSRPPDALVGPHALLGTLGVQPALQGVRGDADWEPYVLLSSQVARNQNAVPGRVIGVVDILGRAGTQDFVSKLLGASDVKLKRVTKAEDLLALLQFSAVDAILVPKTAVKDITERSRMSLTAKPLTDGRVKLVAVGLLTPKARAAVLSPLQALDADTKRTLGVDRWRAP